MTKLLFEVFDIMFSFLGSKMLNWMVELLLLVQRWNEILPWTFIYTPPLHQRVIRGSNKTILMKYIFTTVTAYAALSHKIHQ